MAEIDVYDYIGFFFNKSENFNKEAFDAISFMDAPGELMLPAGIIIVLAIANIFMYFQDNNKYEKRDFLIKISNCIGGVILCGFAYMYVCSENYNKNITEITNDKYVELAYMKDVLSKDDFSDSLTSYANKFGNESASGLIKLNAFKDSPKVKSIVDRINTAAKGGYITNIEYKNIKDDITLLIISHMETPNDIEKVKINLGIDIKN